MSEWKKQRKLSGSWIKPSSMNGLSSSRRILLSRRAGSEKGTGVAADSLKSTWNDVMAAAASKRGDTRENVLKLILVKAAMVAEAATFQMNAATKAICPRI